MKYVNTTSKVYIYRERESERFIVVSVRLLPSECVGVYVVCACVGLVWFGLVWFGLVWFGLVWFGLVWLKRFAVECISVTSIIPLMSLSLSLS